MATAKKPAAKKAPAKKKTAAKKLDGLAVTIGPGLITSLMIGIETAKTSCTKRQLHNRCRSRYSIALGR